MKKPPIFRLQDALVFGVPALFVGAFALYMSLNADPGTPNSAYILMWLVAGLFAIFYSLVVSLRAKFLAAFKYAIPDNFLVNPSSYIVSQENIRSEIDRVTLVYEKIYPNIRELIRGNETYVQFSSGLLPAQTEFGVKRMGYVIVGGNVAYVAYLSPDQPVNETALGHEIGHILIGRATNEWDCEKHHDIMKKLELS